MRRTLALIAVTALIGCGGGAGIDGEYTLVSIDGHALPAPYVSVDTTWVESLVLVIGSDGSFSYAAVTDEESTDGSGTFTVNDDGSLHFVPGPESDGEPFDGTVDGNELTAESQDRIFVFER